MTQQGFGHMSDAELEEIVRAAIRLDVKGIAPGVEKGQQFSQAVSNMAYLRGIMWQSLHGGLNFLKLQRELDQEEAQHEAQKSKG